jgi:flagellar hook-associated protein 1 FlgK
VNALHSTGYTLSGQTGKYFFDNSQVPASGDNTGAANYIQLSADVQNNPDNIAAGGQSGSPGDNENALKILGIQTDATIQINQWTYADRGTSKSSSLQTGTLDSYYQSLVGDIGTLADQTNQNQSFSQSTLDQLNTVRDSTSGVNLDEEMGSLMKIQQAYQAGAKIVSIADDMMQSLLEIT